MPMDSFVNSFPQKATGCFLIRIMASLQLGSNLGSGNHKAIRYTKGRRPGTRDLIIIINHWTDAPSIAARRHPIPRRNQQQHIKPHMFDMERYRFLLAYVTTNSL
jgi:hypothetical protein